MTDRELLQQLLQICDHAEVTLTQRAQNARDNGHFGDAQYWRAQIRVYLLIRTRIRAHLESPHD